MFLKNVCKNIYLRQNYLYFRGLVECNIKEKNHKTPNAVANSGCENRYIDKLYDSAYYFFLILPYRYNDEIFAY